MTPDNADDRGDMTSQGDSSMDGSRRKSGVLLVIFIIQFLAFGAIFCIGAVSGADQAAQNEVPIADHPDIENRNASDSADSNSEGAFYNVTVQGHVTSVYEGCYYKIYVDKVVMGYGLDGISGFKLVPGTTVETTAVSPCPDINMGDCVEVHGYWSTTDSPPIYLESQDAYINKIACSTRNHPPMIMARPSGPKAGNVETAYSYAISANDPDRDLMKFTFDWGDGTISETGFVNSGRSASASHAWSRAGIYWVKVKTTDSKGAAASWSKPLIVNIKQRSKPATPTAPAGTSTGSIETSYIFASSATSPDRDQMRFIFDWGDGTTSETGFASSGRQASVSHEWSDTGVYWVKSRAIDSKGASSPWSKPLIVTIKQKARPTTPNMPVGPTLGSIGMVYKFAISGQDSSRGTLYSYASSSTNFGKDQMRYIFDWGDGTTSETGYVRQGRLTSALHQWDDAGVYWVKARSIDGIGTSSAWSKPLVVTIKQSNKPLMRAAPAEVIAPTGEEPSQGGTGASSNYKFSTSAMDPNKIFMIPSIDPDIRG